MVGLDTCKMMEEETFLLQALPGRGEYQQRVRYRIARRGSGDGWTVSVVVLAAGGMAIHTLPGDLRDPLLAVFVLQFSLVMAAVAAPLSRS